MPQDIESGEIVFGQDGKDSDCTLIYTGPGETTDRVLNLAGKTARLTIDHSGTGPLKVTSPILISGYGANKTIILTGNGGSGELTAPLTNPHDQTHQATTSLIKSGLGKWTLAAANSYTGLTELTQGTLVLTTERSLSPKAALTIEPGATLELNFKGKLPIYKLTLDGKVQPVGVYSSANSAGFIMGSGSLSVE